MEFAAQIIFIGALLLTGSILSSLVSERLGAPVLLLFLIIGMLAGDNGPGHIHFNNFYSANLLGNLALAIILFDGGLRTHLSDFKVGLKPALSLATVGVLVTTLITGSVAAHILHLPWAGGLLIGAIVASTDAAAVFSLMHQHSLELKKRIAATLEIESGSNDPMAVFLTISLVEMLASGHMATGWELLQSFLMQMSLGVLAGLVGGRLIASLINHLALDTSLYPLLALAGGGLVFSGTSLIGGSGFLAIYLAGMTLGNQRIQARQNILRVNNGFAWLAQICMFLMLGLLVTPAKLLPIGLHALLIALTLILVGRPVGVLISLLPFRFPLRDQAFISWVGLRGAVPIVLATFPLLAGLPRAHTYFNVAFVVVLVSLILQGWTMAFAARRLGVEVPPRPRPIRIMDMDIPGQPDYGMVGYRLAPESLAVNQPIRELPMPVNTRLSGVLRDGQLLDLTTLEKLLADDYVFLLTGSEHIEALNQLFIIPTAPAKQKEQSLFGDFVLNGDAHLADVAMLYGFRVDARDQMLTLAHYITRSMKGRPVVGDRVALRPVDLVVREMEGETVSRVGIKFRQVREI